MALVQNKVIHEIGPQPELTPVGWVNVGELPSDPNYYAVDVVAGLVGEDGGQLLKVREGLVFDRRSYFECDGFFVVRACRSVIPAPEGYDPSPYQKDFEFSPGYDCRDYALCHPAGLLGRGSVWNSGRSELNPSWLVGSEQLLNGLKSALGEHALDYAYPQLYYGLNGYTYRTLTNRLHGVDSQQLPARDALLADPDMAKQTASEREKLERIAVKLGVWLGNIEYMKRELRFDSDLPPKDVLGEYLNLRDLGTKLYTEAKGLTDDLAIARTAKVFGKQTFRLNGGGPNASEEDEAFARELGRPGDDKFDYYVDLLKKLLAKRVDKVVGYRADIGMTLAMLEELALLETGKAGSTESL